MCTLCDKFSAFQLSLQWDDRTTGRGLRTGSFLAPPPASDLGSLQRRMNQFSQSLWGVNLTTIPNVRCDGTCRLRRYALRWQHSCLGKTLVLCNNKGENQWQSFAVQMTDPGAITSSIKKRREQQTGLPFCLLFLLLFFPSLHYWLQIWLKRENLVSLLHILHIPGTNPGKVPDGSRIHGWAAHTTGKKSRLGFEFSM